MQHFPYLRTCCTALTAVTCAVLVGCTTANPHDVQRPIEAAEQWHASLPHQGSQQALAGWWLQFQDPVLSQLIQAAEQDSPSLAQAWAAIEKSRANAISARADGLPSLNGNAALSRTRQQLRATEMGTVTSRSAGLDASWELDLFGKLRHSQDAALARVSARLDDWHDARISLAAEVADTYVQYRACQLLEHSYAQESKSKQQTLRATEAAVKIGFTAPADAALAQASRASTEATLAAQRAECAVLVKSLVALTGMDEPGLHHSLNAIVPTLQEPRGLAVPSVPAQTLRQRPDIASLEREAAAAGAEVGVARADFYPSFSLSGAISVAATSGAAGLTTWSFGPALSIPLFDGGKRRAAVIAASANYESAMAMWRQGVRTAIKEVEQALVNLDSAQQRSLHQGTASAQYGRYLKAAEQDWRAGRISLLALEEARRSALSAQIQHLTAQRDRLRYWIALYKSLGGGWEAGMPAVQASLASQTEK